MEGIVEALDKVYRVCQGTEREILKNGRKKSPKEHTHSRRVGPCRMEHQHQLKGNLEINNLINFFE